jgi:predicted membrane protein
MSNQNVLMKVLAGLDHPMARLLSFMIAIGLSTFIFLFSKHIARDLTQLDHGLLGLVMLATCGCFVHGIGFKPYNIFAKVIFSPILCWPISALAVWMWIL